MSRLNIFLFLLFSLLTLLALAGPKRGETLEAVPVSMTEWADWRGANPDAVVLAPPLDADQYVKNAYGDYATSDRLLFPVSAQDASLHAKKVIYGVELGDHSIAVDSEWLSQSGGWEHDIEGQSVRLVQLSPGHQPDRPAQPLTPLITALLKRNPLAANARHAAA